MSGGYIEPLRVGDHCVAKMGSRTCVLAAVHAENPFSDWASVHPFSASYGGPSGGCARFLHLPAVVPRSGANSSADVSAEVSYRHYGHAPVVSEESKGPSTVRAGLFQLLEGLEGRVQGFLERKESCPQSVS